MVAKLVHSCPVQIEGSEGKILRMLGAKDFLSPVSPRFPRPFARSLTASHPDNLNAWNRLAHPENDNELLRSTRKMADTVFIHRVLP